MAHLKLLALVKLKHKFFRKFSYALLHVRNGVKFCLFVHKHQIYTEKLTSLLNLTFTFLMPVSLIFFEFLTNSYLTLDDSQQINLITKISYKYLYASLWGTFTQSSASSKTGRWFLLY